MPDDRVLMHAVGLTFELVDAGGELEDALTLFLEDGKCFGDAIGRVADDFRQPPRVRRISVICRDE